MLEKSNLPKERQEKIIEKFKVMKFSKPKPVVDTVDKD